MNASDRGSAFRCLAECPEPPEADGLQEVLGQLPLRDHYFMSVVTMSQGEEGGFESVINGMEPVEAFLTATRFTRTLITDARFDDVAPGPALVAAMQELSRYMMGENGTPLLDVTTAATDPDGSGGRIIMKFETLPGQWSAATRIIEHPVFNSGHMVAMSEPERFFTVVRDFLEQPAETDSVH